MAVFNQSSSIRSVDLTTIAGAIFICDTFGLDQCSQTFMICGPLSLVGPCFSIKIRNFDFHWFS